MPCVIHSIISRIKSEKSVPVFLGSYFFRRFQELYYALACFLGSSHCPLLNFSEDSFFLSGIVDGMHAVLYARGFDNREPV